MPSFRIRSYDNRGLVTGSLIYHNTSTTVTRSMQTGQYGTCNDFTNGDHVTPMALTIEKQNRQYPRLMGQLYSNPGNTLLREFNNFPIGYNTVGAPWPDGVIGAPSTVEKSNLAWKVLSEANPSAPDISLPTFLAELKDIPSLVKNWYGLFLKKDLRPWKGQKPAHWQTLLKRVPEIVASGHLTWRWAVRPFIDDVQRLLDVSYLVKRRLHMLGELSTKRKIRRRVSLGTTSKYTVSNATMHSEGATVGATQHDTTIVKMWGTVSYSAPPNLKLPQFSEDACALAQRLVLGITSYEALSTAWELMPWSWFVDWFTGLGTVIRANNNSIGLTAGPVCIMRHATSTRLLLDNGTKPSWVTLVGPDWRCTYEIKSRYVAGPLLPYAPSFLPIFEGKAWSILGSLAVLKERPSLYLGKPLRKKRNGLHAGRSIGINNSGIWEVFE